MTNNTSPAHPMAHPVIYEIAIAEQIDPRRLFWFDGMTVVAQPDGETRIIGPVIDQAALYGLLNRLRDLGLTLLWVKRQDS